MNASGDPLKCSEQPSRDERKREDDDGDQTMEHVMCDEPFVEG